MKKNEKNEKSEKMKKTLTTPKLVHSPVEKVGWMF